MSIITDETLAGLFTRQGPGSAMMGATAGQGSFQLIGHWDDGQPFNEWIVADSCQDAINKAFERFDPLVERLTVLEVF